MITLYDADRCPYCARVRIVLAEKGVEYETVVIDLDDRPAWIYEKNATGRVPVLEEDAFVLPESAVIDEYLNERYPEPPLLPADPAERSLARVMTFRFDNLSRPYYRARRGDEGARAALGSTALRDCRTLRRGDEGARATLDIELAKLERLLEARPFLTGREFGLADIAYVPWILRARDRMDVELDAFPALRDWVEGLAERPSIAAEIDVVAAL